MLAWALCTDHLADVTGLLRATCTLFALAVYKAVRAMGAWRLGVMCRWAGPVSEKVKFKLFSESRSFSFLK